MAREVVDVINQEPTDDEVESLMSMARSVRDATYPYITFSPKVGCVCEQSASLPACLLHARIHDDRMQPALALNADGPRPSYWIGPSVPRGRTICE